MSKKVIIVMGSPGAGKGTQAELISKKFDLFNLDTGRSLEKLFYFSGKIKSPIIKKERSLFKSGKLVSPKFVLKIIKNDVKKIALSGMGVVFSGSPRTEFEAFGDSKSEGLISYLEKLYKKNNIIVFYINVPGKEATRRNVNRVICSICGSEILTNLYDIKKLPKKCPFCGGELRKRVIDNSKTMKIRLVEYNKRTKPVIEKIKKLGYKTYEIKGDQAPYKVFESIQKILNGVFKR